MKVSKAQAAENHARILEEAGRLFRDKGFDGVGVSELMSAAGLTNGAFYGHFASKEDLAAKACERVLASGDDPWAALPQDAQGGALAKFVDDYLSPRHLEHRENGCLYAALAGDVARQPEPVRQAFTENLRVRLASLVNAVTGGSKAARRRKALATMSTMVGALALARAVDDDALAREILAAAKDFSA